MPAGACAKLSAYLDLLAKWNRIYNLTAVRERRQMESQHVNDALAVLPFLPETSARLLDVGSGCGVPGIPLAIARPQLRIVLLDANRKKIAFLTQAVIELDLANVRAVAARSEEYVPQAPFDVVISRAFSDLGTFVAVAARHAAADGVMIAMKGALPREEIAALPDEIVVRATPALTVPGLDAQRHLVLMRRREPKP